MSQLLPLHNYADILEVTRPPSPLPPLAAKRRLPWLAVRQSLYTASANRPLRAVERLTFEILYQVFHIWLTMSPIVYTDQRTSGPLRPGLYTNLNQQLSPLTLSHVCACWRAVITSIPKFWTSLVIVGPLYNQAYAVETWLGCAGTQSTNIRLIQLDTRRASHEIEEATDQVLSAVFRHSTFIQRLRLEFRCIAFQKSLSQIKPNHLDRLEAIHVELPPWAERIRDRDRFWAKLFQARLLYSVSWDTVDIPPPTHLSRWMQITCINIDGQITELDLWSFIEVAPQLIRLRARGIYLEPTDPELDPGYLSHLSLQHLDLEFKSSPNVILGHLEVPNLVSLRVAHNTMVYNADNVFGPMRALERLIRSIRSYYHPSDLNPFAPLAFHPFIVSSESNFTHLTILDPTIPEVFLLHFLDSLQLKNLEYLGLDYATEDLVDRLNPDAALARSRYRSYSHAFVRLRKLEVFNRYAPMELPNLDSDKNAGNGEGDTFERRERDKKKVYRAVKRLLKARPRGEFVVCLNPCRLVLDSETSLM